MIPYGRQIIGDDDIAAVVEVLKSDWLTTGPKVEEFEQAICAFTGAKHAVAVSSGTAGLHAAMFAAGIGPGDEVVVTPMTFAASSNCIIYQGGAPSFADVDPATLLIDPAKVRKKITKRTKAVIAVDYAGQPCDYGALRKIADEHGLLLVSDACHSIGGSRQGRNVGTLADMTVFSFHPVKHITTGEGGMIVTDRADLAAKMRVFRNHGITTDHRQRQQQGAWSYEMVELGYNYRITDFQCALGISQLKKLPGWIVRRQAIARSYDAAFGIVGGLKPLKNFCAEGHAYHLYIVRITGDDPMDRDRFFKAMRAKGVGVNVHYSPVHLHPYYREKLGCTRGMCPEAERASLEILSLPMYAGLEDSQLRDVQEAVRTVLESSG